MSSWHLLRSVLAMLAGCSRERPLRGCCAPSGRRVVLEALEDRRLLSVVQADSSLLADYGDSAQAYAASAGSAAVFDLSSLDGTNGFRLDGDAGDRLGYSVSSAGDVNGDGFDDVIIGAVGANSTAGATYVVFGRSGGFLASFDPSALDGSNGFRIDGIDAEDLSGHSVSSAGDVNGDGFDDLIIGTPKGGPVYGHNSTGESYVVFGHSGSFSASFDLSSLDGTNGFRLAGIDANDHFGHSVSSAGDVNGDGFDDLIIGAPYADPHDFGYAGETYVVFGHSGGFSASVDLSTLDGTNGFRLNGIGFVDHSGFAVSSAGDVNGDGFDDVLIGAHYADFVGRLSAGATYVVYGHSNGFPASFDLSTLNGANGFRFEGVSANDESGYSVSSAGDVNGDGFDDLIIGAPYGDPGGDYSAGESYVVFGGFPTWLRLWRLNGSNGFRIDGIDAGDYSGHSVSSAGDFNGDGLDDLMIGAHTADPDGDYQAGETYVVFGQLGGFSASFDLSTLDGTNGFWIDGIDRGDQSGESVSSAGDFNGDGFADLMIGADLARPGGVAGAGATYIVFGGNPAPGPEEFDFGDAPEPGYPTLLASNGAYHVASGPMLGGFRDGELDGTPSMNADGDDLSGVHDDEDGVTLTSTLTAGQTEATLAINVQNAPAGAKLDAWIDFDGDGSWDTGDEQIARDLAVPEGTTRLRFNVPSWATAGDTYARFRLSTSGNLAPTGPAGDGEVEDYQVSILPPAPPSSVFGPQQSIATDVNYAYTVYAADLDGDGDQDVLTASYNDDWIAWYENDGNGNFGARQVVTTDVERPGSVYTADLDGDGDQDVLSASAGDDKIAWYENDGGGSFGPQQVITTAADEAQSVFAADLDGDGDQDVLSASSRDNKIAWYENDGNGNFATLRVITTDVDGADSVYSADLDGDGDQDVLSASVNDNKIAWYPNMSGGTFGAQQIITTAAQYVKSVFAADLDGDGDPDVLSASLRDHKIA